MSMITTGGSTYSRNWRQVKCSLDTYTVFQPTDHDDDDDVLVALNVNDDDNDL